MLTRILLVLVLLATAAASADGLASLQPPRHVGPPQPAEARTLSAPQGSASFPSEQPTLSGDVKGKKSNIPDGSRNGENVSFVHP
jgi:hypothetical protein